MAEIINLNRARKAKKRVDKEMRADVNRAKFGRAKAQREAAVADRERRDRLLDGARRGDTPASGSEPGPGT